MRFDELIQLQVLKHKAMLHGKGCGSGRALDMALEKGEFPELRQMCARIHAQVHERLENVTAALEMTKREFVEAALIDALNRAEDALGKVSDPQGSL